MLTVRLGGWPFIISIINVVTSATDNTNYCDFKMVNSSYVNMSWNKLCPKKRKFSLNFLHLNCKNFPPHHWHPKSSNGSVFGEWSFKTKSVQSPTCPNWICPLERTDGEILLQLLQKVQINTFLISSDSKFKWINTKWYCCHLAIQVLYFLFHSVYFKCSHFVFPSPSSLSEHDAFRENASLMHFPSHWRPILALSWQIKVKVNKI